MTTLAPTLAHVAVAYCDSLAALRLARDEGLPRTARIRTAAPAVHAAGLPGVEGLADCTGDYWQAGSDLTRAAHAELTRRPATAPRALLATRALLTAHRQLQKATTLGPEDFAAPRAALLVATGSAAQDAVLNAPWPAFFAAHPQFVERRYPVDAGPSAAVGDGGWRGRLQRLTWSRLAYRGAMRLAGPVAAVTRKQLLVFRENELVEDVALALVGRGYACSRLQPPPSRADQPDDELEALAEALAPLFGRFAEQWFAPEVRPAAWAMARAALAESLAVHGSSHAAWLDRLKRCPSGRTVVLTNFPGGADAVALADACRALSIPLVAAQHGVTREISASHGPIEAFFENGVAALFLVFNETARRISDASPFRRGHSSVVGLPRAYRRPARSRRLNRRYPLLYISTALMKGNVNLATGSASDIARSKRERALVADVLSQLPHPVLYKSYPSRDRYLDPDPLFDDIARHPGIGLFSAPVDLRYFVREHRVLVAARATSTIGWCLMADRPLVFIDFPDDSPLSPEARALFERGLFLFEWRTPDMLARLRAFLSRPIDEIEDLWRRKAGDRAELMQSHISSFASGAGGRGAQAIEALLAANAALPSHALGERLGER